MGWGWTQKEGTDEWRLGTNWTHGWPDGWVGIKGLGWGQEECCLPSVLAAAASVTHSECWMS